MSKRMTQAKKTMIRLLIADAKTYLEASEFLMFEGDPHDLSLDMLERRALAMIAAVQQYRQSTNPLFTKGQKA